MSEVIIKIQKVTGQDRFSHRKKKQNFGCVPQRRLLTLNYAIIILKRIQHFSDKHKIIPLSNTASEADIALWRKLSERREGFRDKNKSVMVTIDIQKAFDSI